MHRPHLHKPDSGSEQQDQSNSRAEERNNRNRDRIGAIPDRSQFALRRRHHASQQHHASQRTTEQTTEEILVNSPEQSNDSAELDMSFLTIPEELFLSSFAPPLSPGSEPSNQSNSQHRASSEQPTWSSVTLTPPESPSYFFLDPPTPPSQYMEIRRLSQGGGALANFPPINSQATLQQTNARSHLAPSIQRQYISPYQNLSPYPADIPLPAQPTGPFYHLPSNNGPPGAMRNSLPTPAWAYPTVQFPPTNPSTGTSHFSGMPPQFPNHTGGSHTAISIPSLPVAPNVHMGNNSPFQHTVDMFFPWHPTSAEEVHPTMMVSFPDPVPARVQRAVHPSTRRVPPPVRNEPRFPAGPRQRWERFSRRHAADDPAVEDSAQASEQSRGCVRCGKTGLVVNVPCGHAFHCAQCITSFRATQGDICCSCRQPSQIQQILHERECELCFEKVSIQHIIETADCGHLVCLQCATSHIRTCLKDLSSYPVHCPKLSDSREPCKQVLTLRFVENLRQRLVQHNIKPRLSDSDVSRFEQNTIASGIPPENRMFCLNPTCEKALYTEPLATKQECVYCDELLCFSCKSFWHEGMSCAQFKQTQEQEAADPLSKPCPNCGTRITHYKNQGCHHIKCPNCALEFCYECLSLEYKNSHINPANGLPCSMMCNDNCHCPDPPQAAQAPTMHTPHHLHRNYVHIEDFF